MPTIEIVTEIYSSLDVCFDLSRSIELHEVSTAKTREKAVAGKISGLLELNEIVTWEATHFCVRQKLSSKITIMERPALFVDEQVKGAFKYFKHIHNFKRSSDRVIMTDVFEFKSPLGFLGDFADFVFLTRYMRQLLLKRNMVIKKYAETDGWKRILNGR